jgi:predicted ATPase
LRNTFGASAAISGTAAGYALDVEEDSVDAIVFERTVRAADESLRANDIDRAAGLIADSLKLWRGRAFADLADDGPLRIEAERLEELRLHAVERRLELEIEQGRSSEVVDELRALTARFPFRERIWQLLMLALYHSGRQAEALAAYRDARRELDDQLGVEPGADLQALEMAILRQEVPTPGRAAWPDTLPEPMTEFIGRDDEIATLEAAITRKRIVTLTGIGGVGKTRLALEVARRVRNLASDGRLFIRLAPFNDEGSVIRAVTSALGIRDGASGDLSERLARAIGDARLLIVLDNCEHVVDAAAMLAGALLASAPNTRILATSRRPLGLPGELEYAVLPLAVPPPESSSADLLRSDAVRLLLRRAYGTDETNGTEDQAMAAGRICRDLDGLPLAIELAAARAKVLSLNEIAGRLDDRFRFLVSWRRVGAGQHQTLKQAMDWSYELLDPADRTTFETVAVFSDGFTLEAAAAVVSAGDDNEALESVTRLVDASLVRVIGGPAETRFRLLQTVREYGAARLIENGAMDDARDRHAKYFAELAARAEPELTGPDQALWFARLDADHANLLAALDYLTANRDGQVLLQFTVRLTRFWYVRGHIAEARERLERALEAADDVDAALRRRALTAASSMALIQGDYAAATRLGEMSLAAARETGEERLVANGLSNLGAIVLAAGDQARAGELLESAVALGRQVGDSRILAMALNNLADHALTVGDYQRAEPLFDESLNLLREHGDTANVARSLFNLGAVALRLGRIDDAEARLNESIVDSRGAGDKEDMCWAMLGLASVSAARADGERSAILLGAASALLRSMGADFKPFERALHDDTAQQVRELIGEQSYEEARARGAALSLESALEIAVGA